MQDLDLPKPKVASNNPLSMMMIAAYITWAAIGMGLWSNFHGAPWTDLSKAANQIAAMLAHLGFLILLLWRVLRPLSPQGHALAIALQAILALLLCALSRYSAVPVLSILVVSQWYGVLTPRVALSHTLVLNLVLYLIFILVWNSSPIPSLLALLTYGGFQAFAAITVLALRDSEQQREQLGQINAELIATRHLLEDSARDQERLRLARELHDVAGHKLTALKLNLGALHRQLSEPHQAAVGLCVELTSELLSDIRGVVAHLRAHEGMDMHAALAAQARGFPRPRLIVQLDDNAKPADSRQAEAILRAVQEALTNAARHTMADQLHVRLTRVDQHLRLDIHDNGGPTPAITLGHGLNGMRERFELLGGGFEWIQSSGAGLSLRATLPLPNASP